MGKKRKSKKFEQNKKVYGRGKGWIKKPSGKLVATRLGQRLVLLGAGPVGVAASMAMTAVDIVLLGKLAFEIATAESVGGVSKGDVGAARGTALDARKVKRYKNLKKALDLPNDRANSMAWASLVGNTTRNAAKEEFKKLEKEVGSLESLGTVKIGGAITAQAKKELAVAKKANRGSKRSMYRLRNDYLKLTAFQGDQYEIRKTARATTVRSWDFLMICPNRTFENRKILRGNIIWHQRVILKS